jgi:hypothetical protein
MQDPRRRAAVGLWVGGSDGIGTREPWAAGGRNQSGGNGREGNGRHACDRRVPGDSPVDGAPLPRGGGGGVLADPLIRLGAGLGRRRPPPLSGRDEDGVRGDGGRGGGRRRWRRRLPLRSLHVRGLRPPSSSMNGGGAARTRLCRGAGGESDWRRGGGGGGGGGGRGFYRAVAVGGFCVAPLCQLPLLLRGACCFPSVWPGPPVVLMQSCLARARLASRHLCAAYSYVARRREEAGDRWTDTDAPPPASHLRRVASQCNGSAVASAANTCWTRRVQMAPTAGAPPRLQSQGGGLSSLLSPTRAGDTCRSRAGHGAQATSSQDQSSNKTLNSNHPRAVLCCPAAELNDNLLTVWNTIFPLIIEQKAS